MSSQAVPIMGVWDNQRKAIVGSYSLLLPVDAQDRAIEATWRRAGTTDYELIPVEDWAAKASAVTQAQKEI